MHVYTEARSVPNACRYTIHAFRTLHASVFKCIIDFYVEILTATVARMHVVTLYTNEIHGQANWKSIQIRYEAQPSLNLTLDLTRRGWVAQHALALL